MAEMTMTYEELCKSRCEGCREKWPTYARGYPMANPGSFPNVSPVWGRTVHCPPGASRVMADEANQINDGQVFCTAPSIQAAYTEARAQVAALTQERDTLQAELAAAKQATERLEQAIDPALTVASEILRRRVLGTGEDHHRWEIAFLRLEFLRLRAACAPEGTEGIGHDETAA